MSTDNPADDTDEQTPRDALEQRVDRLETEIERLTPEGVSRRDLMAGGAAAGVGAAAGPGLIELIFGSAAADTTAGDVGTASNPVDIFASHIQLGSQLALIDKPASGQVTLSSGKATVSTGISATDATFYLALGADDPGSDVKVTGRLFFDTSAGTYKIEIVEDGTSVGNPTVNYDVLRVR